MNEEEKQDEAYKKGIERGINAGLLLAAIAIVLIKLISFLLWENVG
jgi:hypothetical protein